MKLVIAIVTAAFSLAGPALADSLSDPDYLQLARCAGLTRGGGQDDAAFRAALRRAQMGRSLRVVDQGRTRQRAASLDMRAARGEARATLESERASRCPALLRSVAL